MKPVLSALVLTLLFGSTQAGPPLPALAMDAFPVAARETLSRAYDHAVKHPEDADAVGALGRALHAWEQWETAHQVYARAQSLAPGAFDWHYLDALALQRLARHEDAARQLRAALAATPDYLPARVKLAEALLERGAFAESRRQLEALVREPAAEPAVQVGLGRIAAAEGRHADAITHFERAIALFPELGAAYYGLARSYRAVGRTADSERALSQHARYGARWPGIEDPVGSSVATLRDDARALLQKGIASAAAGDVEAAIAAHEAAFARDPSLVNIHANLVSLYGRTKNWTKAEAHYRAAVAAGFTPADLHYDYGVILGLQEKYDEAEEAYRRAVATNPLHGSARNNLGQLLERKAIACSRRAGSTAACGDEFQQALAEYRRATEAQPSLRIARFNLGRMLLVLRQPAEAALEFERLQQPRDDETPRYLFALSTAYVHAGRKADGIRVGSEAQRLALELGQTDLAAVIARELAGLK